MTTEKTITDKYGRFKITTKKGLTFELIVEHWLKEGDYEFGKVELMETLNIEKRNDYLDAVNSLFKMSGIEDE